VREDDGAGRVHYDGAPARRRQARSAPSATRQHRAASITRAARHQSPDTHAGDALTLSTEAELIEKLRKIESLFARPGTEGERAAAGNARDRIRGRLRRLERLEPALEFRFTHPDPWSHRLFVAMLRRYDLVPYRYRGQRRTTVMVEATRSFLEQTLWPEFCEADQVLRQHLHEVTERIIAGAISGDAADLEERDASGAARGGHVEGGGR